MGKGIAASPGITIGKTYVFKEQSIDINKEKIDESSVKEEINKFNNALEVSKRQLNKIKERVTQKIGEQKAKIFDAHLMILDDPTLTTRVENKIKDELVTADNAVDSVIKELVKVFESMEDEYMKERAADFKDLGKRLLKNILGIPILSLLNLEEEVVIVAEDLTPSDTAQMDKNKVLGFVTEVGGRTSHTAIMARSLEIPAVVGVKGITQKAKNNDTIIVDGNEGEVVLNPSEKVLKQYQAKRESYLQWIEELKELKELPAETKDGHRIEIAANIGTPRDVKGALKNGAEGIGLYRTEFLYMDRDSMPGEEEQFEAYKQVAEKMEGKPVIIRTLDIGGDKDLPYLELPEEMNPFLGVRAVRLCLKNEKMFLTQLRAILRASHYGNIKIMYPMVSTVEEVKMANAVLDKARKQLDEKNIPYDKDIEVGIMVEIPSTAVNADIFAKEVDFFSIGTNDLIQYTLAVDRMNESLSKLYDPFNPAILRLVKKVIDASHQEGKWTGMCGEMAGEPRAALILLGMGLDEFSMSAISIPTIKKIIRSVTREEAEKIAEKVLKMQTSQEICDFIDSKLKDIL